MNFLPWFADYVWILISEYEITIIIMSFQIQEHITEEKWHNHLMIQEICINLMELLKV